MSTQTEQPKPRDDHGERITENLKTVENRVVVFSGKGGVGKTTIAVNLAYALAKRRKAVGVLDADITGPDVPKMIGLRQQPQSAGNHRMLPPERHGVKVMSFASLLPPGSPVIWRGPLRAKALEQFMGDVEWGNLDYLLADLPPGTGDEVLTMAQRMKPRMAVVVTTPQEMSLIDCRRAINMAKRMGIDEIGVVENMSWFTGDDGKRYPIFGEGGGRELAAELEVPLLGQVPLVTALREGADEGRPVGVTSPGSEAAAAFFEIARRIIDLRPRVRTHPELIIS